VLPDPVRVDLGLDVPLDDRHASLPVESGKERLDQRGFPGTRGGDEVERIDLPPARRARIAVAASSADCWIDRPTSMRTLPPVPMRVRIPQRSRSSILLDWDLPTFGGTPLRASR